MGRLTAMLSLLVALAVPAIAAPAIAAQSASPNRQQQFGDLTIHYNAFSSSMLPPVVARDAGLLRSKSQGVINITAIRNGKTVQASVSGTIKDLMGQEKPLMFKPVNENSAVNYIAQFAVEPDSSATYIFTVNVKTADDQAHTLSFNQEIFSDQ